jgi:hypothetical protein
VPFRGVEPGLAGHVLRLAMQDYPDYRLVLVVQSMDDPAAAVLHQVMQRRDLRAGPVELVEAGPAPADTGQKVHNLLQAMRHLEQDPSPPPPGPPPPPEEGGNEERVLVFADSDAAPGEGWLGDLIGPLQQPHITAVTTGYRWLVPLPDKQGELHPASVLASVLNGSVACWMSRRQQTHAWGGSMAMRVSTAQRGGLMDLWRGAISDDYQVSHMASRLPEQIMYVPRCLVASPVAMDWQQLVNFAHRQHLITRVHAPKLFWAGLGVLALYPAAWISSLVAAVVLLSMSGGWPLWWLPPGAAFVIVLVADQVRATYRWLTVRNAFDPATVDRLRPALRVDRWLTPLWMTAHLLLMLRATVGRTISWRGIRYRIDSPQKVRRMPRE